MARSRKKGKSLQTNLKFELYGILILTFSVIALSRVGSVARSVTYLLRFLIGSWDFVIPLVFIYIGLYVMVKREWPGWWSTRKAGLFLFVLGLLLKYHISLFHNLYPNGDYTAPMVLAQTWQRMLDALPVAVQSGALSAYDVGGGMVGAIVYALLYFLFDDLGAKLIQYTLFAIGLLLITRLSYVDIMRKVRTHLGLAGSGFTEQWKQLGKLLISPKAHNKKPKKVGKPAFVPMDDEFDEEMLRPEPKIAKKKQPVFFDLLKLGQGSSKAKDSSAKVKELSQEDFEDDQEETVYVAEPSKAAGKAIYSQDDDYEDDDQLEEEFVPVIRDFQEHEDDLGDQPSNPVVQQDSAMQQVEVQASDAADEASEAPVVKPKPNPKPYKLPAFHLLSKPAGSGKGGDAADYKANARKLEATLESFGVRAKVLEVVRGPSVTRYEIQPDTGVKVSRIVSLTDDIALALAAKDIRMEAPIPGKSAIGIEVPNSEVSVVTMREVMETSAFQDAGSKLTITLGRDISGQPIVGNLARMPHLLVAGATGSGKSVCINGIITSILYKAKPDEVKFLMIDPKMVELNVYNGIPHLLAPVVTDPRRASLALKQVVREMEKRYELFSKSGTRNIEGYNAMLNETKSEAPLPYYVVIVDELADLMMVAANDVEDAICRLAQMARAAGIHLIIATQRPSVDVITGVIKANIPSRIAFGVSSQVDSRTILDMVGAEKLLGRGDMLYLPMGASKPVRVQGAFLSDQEVEAVVGFCRTQEQANYQEEMVPQVEETQEAGEQFEDELYDQAVQIVLEAKQASVSLLQRRMRVGYTRAARLIDSMEAKGIVGPYEGSKPREVLVTMEQYQHNRISS